MDIDVADGVTVCLAADLEDLGQTTPQDASIGVVQSRFRVLVWACHEARSLIGTQDDTPAQRPGTLATTCSAAIPPPETPTRYMGWSCPYRRAGQAQKIGMHVPPQRDAGENDDLVASPQGSPIRSTIPLEQRCGIQSARRSG